MEKDFVPYDIALELKQLGVDEPCFAWYVSKDYGVEIGMVIKSDLIKEAILAPTFSQSFRFFRENHKLDGFVQIEPLNEKYGYVTYDRKKGNYTESKRKYTPEEAELACLIKLIEIVKKRQ